MAGEQQEPWVKWVALTTTILAVCAALASMKGGGCSTKTQLMTTQESNKWSYYQSKSIKQHVMESERAMLKLESLKDNNPAVKAEVASQLKDIDENIVRYDKEKAGIKADAEALAKEQIVVQKHGGNFGMAVMLIQIAIMLSAIGVLLKQPYAWYLGVVLGSLGIVYFVNGFILFF